MKKLNNWQNLLIALAVELVIFLVGREFFYPISAEELAHDLNLRMGCLAIYACSLVLGIAVIAYCTPVQLFKLAERNQLGSLIIILLVVIIAPRWLITLTITTGITVVLLVLEWTKPSTS